MKKPGPRPEKTYEAFDVARFMADVRSTRERWGWSQRTIAAATDLPVDSIKRWEQGANVPTLAAVCVLAATCDLSVDEYVIARPCAATAGAGRGSRVPRPKPTLVPPAPVTRP